MNTLLDTLLLLALPASGKSEVRRYLKHVPKEQCASDFRLGPTVQLDDFPYVHLMRRVDDELAARGRGRIFFEAPDRSFNDPRDWGTLIQLVNEDHGDLVAQRPLNENGAGEAMLRRIDAASERVGCVRRLDAIEGPLRNTIAAALDREARELVAEKVDGYTGLAGKTLVIEFARGGKQGSTLPLPAPFGYRYSLAQLSASILERARVLYVWVTPEESRRKNAARADPKDPGSILHHSVPLHVMLNDYGLDDIDWLEKNSDRPGTLTVEAHGRRFHLPMGRFDNRTDRTSFVRDDPSSWKPSDVSALHQGLRAGFAAL